MRVQDAAPPFAMAHITCPGCCGLMRLVAIRTSAFNPHTDEIVYYCAECECEVKRASRPVMLNLRSDIEP
jgi:C4-type Zn-finger protein